MPDPPRLRAQLPPSDPIIPLDLRITWQGWCGVEGGIPTRNTINVSLGVAGQAPEYAQSVTASDISDAIAACDPNEVVYLEQGTYDIDGNIYFLGDGGAAPMTLRGAGIGNTILNMSGNIAVSFNYGHNVDQSPAVIDSGYEKGSTSITLATTPVATVVVGSLISMYQDDVPGLNYRTIGNQPAPDCMAFLAKVTGVSGKTVSFEPPLSYGLSADLNPVMAASPANTPPRRCGVEEMTLNLSLDDQPVYSILFTGAEECWAKNVEITNCLRGITFFNNCYRCEARGCYIHEAPGYPACGPNPGVAVAGFSAFCRIEDNVIVNMGQAFQFEAAISAAVLYNFTLHSCFYASPVAIADLCCNHIPHSMMVLWEGNIGQLVQNDGYHGSTSHQIFMRNWIHMIVQDFSSNNRRGFDLVRGSYYHSLVGNIIGDLSWKNMDGTAVWPGHPDRPFTYEMDLDGAVAGNTVIYKLGLVGVYDNSFAEGWQNALAWGSTTVRATAAGTNFAIVYDVVSDGSDTITSATGGFVSGMIGGVFRIADPPLALTWVDYEILDVPDGNTLVLDATVAADTGKYGVAGIYGFYDEIDLSQTNDVKVKDTILRGGNWDAFNEDVVWDEITEQTIPNSFFYDSKPSYFTDAGCPWPPFDPADQAGAAVDNIPAGVRWNTIYNAPVAPENGDQPTITGSVTEGSTLSIDTEGSWTGNPEPTPAWQWWRSATSDPDDGSAITGETGDDYITTEDDVGFYILIRRVVTNTEGSATDYSSNAIGPIEAGAIATIFLDSTSNANSFDAGGVLTWLHTCADDNTVLVVTPNSLGAACVCTGVKYNNVPMTNLWSVEDNALNYSSAWIMIAPEPGENTIEVTFSGTIYIMDGTASSWNGVDQTTPNRTPVATTHGASSGPSVAMTGGTNNIAAGDMIVNSFGAYGATPPYTASDDELEQTNPYGTYCSLLQSHFCVDGADVTLSWSPSATYFSGGAVALIPA